MGRKTEKEKKSQLTKEQISTIINFQRLQSQLNIIYNAIHIKSIELKALNSEASQIKEKILEMKDAVIEIKKINEKEKKNVK